MPDDRPTRIKAITNLAGRRSWPAHEKLRLVEESLGPGASVSAVARRNGVAPKLLFRWRHPMAEGGAMAVGKNEPVVGASEVRQLEERVRQRERVLGRKTLEGEILRGRSRKAGDDDLLPALRRLVDARSTYGDRRITALLNRARRAEGREPVNRKRVLRSLNLHGLTLEPSTGRRAGPVHDGKVAVMASNLGWCADALEMTCRTDGKVRIALIIYAFDRESIARVAVTGAGISGSDVRDMMLAAVEHRVAADRPPHPVDPLSDNGSCDTAGETRDFARQIGLIPCVTPVRSSESNAMSEAFVKTLKRDDVRITPLPDVAPVLGRVCAWINDDNTVHPYRPSVFRAGPALTRRVQISAQPQPSCPVKGGHSSAGGSGRFAHGQGVRTHRTAAEGPDQGKAGQCAPVRCPGGTPRCARPGPDPDPRHRAVIGAEAGRRVRHRPDRLAERQARHLPALPRPWQQDLRGKAAIVANATLLRLAAVTIGRSDTSLGAFYSRLSSRVGKQKAVTATARKIAVLFYNTPRFGRTYRDPGAAAYEERHQTRVLANLQPRARSPGYLLAPTPDPKTVS